MSEYTGNASNQWGYTQLSRYNAGGAMAPVNAKVVVGTYVVPTWGAIGVDALTKGLPSNGGYFNISNAYGSNAGNCRQGYVTLPCAPCAQGGGNQ